MSHGKAVWRTFEGDFGFNDGVNEVVANFDNIDSVSFVGFDSGAVVSGAIFFIVQLQRPESLNILLPFYFIFHVYLVFEFCGVIWAGFDWSI